MKKLNFRSAAFTACVVAALAWTITNIRTKADQERSLIIIKPDGVAQGLVDTVYQKLREELGLNLIVEKSFDEAPERMLFEHYAEHRDRPFFPGLIAFMQSGPIRVSIWAGGEGTIKSIRDLVGPTDPAKASSRTIRGEFGTSAQRNVIHASDSAQSASREIDIWFRYIIKLCCIRYGLS